MTDETDAETETNHNLNESADKIRVNTRIERGTGTRDQERHTIKVRGDTPAETADRVVRVREELADRGHFKACREVGAGDDKTEDDDE